MPRRRPIDPPTHATPPGAPLTGVVGSGKARVVWYEDVARGGTLTLRWWGGENWRRKSLQRRVERDATGAVAPALIEWAKAQAMKKYLELCGLLEEAPAVAQAPKRLTVGETAAWLVDREIGPYPEKTPFRTEMLAALDFAGTVWGKEKAWADVTPDDWTRLLRQRMGGLIAAKRTGVRGTEITISRLLTVITKAVAKRKLPAGTAPIDPDWKAQIVEYWKGATRSTRDPVVHRPRYTLAEMRRILQVAYATDRRVGLAIVLGAELRLGQVARAQRTDLRFEEGPHGALFIPGSGKKGGTIAEFTRAQREALDHALGPAGYLADAERRFAEGSLPDYYLFPGGRLAGERKDRQREIPVAITAHTRLDAPLGEGALLKRFRRIEAAAGVAYLPGRGWYGLRRQGVDAAKQAGISREGLKAQGGWSDTQVPDAIYAEQDAVYARQEAREVRAKIRGEETPGVHTSYTAPVSARTPDEAPAPTRAPSDDSETA